jgi:hypothetical protein
MRAVVGDRLQVRGGLLVLRTRRALSSRSEDETVHRPTLSATTTDMKVSCSLARTHRSSTGHFAARRPDVKGVAYVNREFRQIL